ncbi:3-phosphoglycerate dehydrogenase family protein [Clostridium minihomine]|uniref:3-phosphoglycerate dehydrogenase family protein n=1 Tax=Clostridium minihomine TaxID=2045012 RepID=UPI000C76D97D|nr:3-phosphoglycerate dehydrogenase family protein [Clostridium minihomine]
MYRIKTLNNIAETGLTRFGQNYEYSSDMENPQGILVRSASMHEMELPEELLAIARAGAGVNNIPVDKCSEQGIVVFNTPGANANAVKELVISALFLTSRRMLPALEWVKTLKGKGSEVSKLVEKGKSQFAGPEIKGKSLGVIGLGAIGIQVANAAKNLGMEVYGYDPYLSVDAAWGLSRWVHHARTLDEVFANCDYLTVHVPLTPDTKYLINEESIQKMKDEVRILNFARGELVETAAMIAGLKSGKISAYATDFPTDELIGVDGVLAIPHLGASTPESEENCARMAVDELKEFLETGNIRNSVNMPSISMPRAHAVRICIFHRNVPNTISLFSGVMAGSGINIENMQSKSKKGYAYTILDVTGEVDDAALSTLQQREEIIRLRVIR